MKKILVFIMVFILTCFSGCSIKNAIENLPSKENTETHEVKNERNVENNNLDDDSSTDSNNDSDDNNTQDEDTTRNQDEESKETKDINDSDSASSNVELNLDNITITTHQGTSEDPIPFGEYFKWEDENYSDSTGYKGSFIASVKSVKKLEDSSELEKYKIEKSEEQEYYLVSLELFGENITATTISRDGIYFTITNPRISGTESPGIGSIIGSQSSGFDTSIDTMIENRYGFEKVTKGESININYSGDVIVAGISGKENLLRVTKADFDSSSGRYIYFKLK